MTSLAPVIPAVVSFLTTALGVPVATKVPNPRPASFVRVTGLGGSQRNLVEADPLILVEAWAPTSADALALANRAWSALEAAEWLSPQVWVDIHRAELPVDLPDPVSEQPRWQFTYHPTVNLHTEES